MKHSLIIIAIAAILVLLIGTTTVDAADTCRVEMPASGQDFLGAKGAWTRLGQRLTIPDRKITAIGYHVRRVGEPTGDVILSIRDSETDMVIFSAVWGDASELDTGGAQGYISVALNPPMRIGGDVRICAEYYGGDDTDYVRAGYFSGDRISGEWYTNYHHFGVWGDIGEAEEGAYMYEYVCEENGNDNTGYRPPMVLLIVGGAWAVVGVIYLARRRRLTP